MSKYLKPLKLQPAFQDYLWGGEKLVQQYGKKLPKNQVKIAESWELSTHANGLSQIETEPFAKQTLVSYLEAAGPEVLGKRFAKANLPILMKLIDAADNLSVQVHPDDDYARKYENANGKTEMWYVMEAEPDAFIYYGLKKKVSPEKFKQAIANQTVTQLLQKVPAKKGDVFFIPAGTIHAIGKGLVIAEVQQACDLTYRVYDYGRVDKNGQTRPLHLDKALDVIKLEPAPKNKIGKTIALSELSRITTLVTYKDFIVKKLEVAEKLELLSLADTYQVLLNLEGDLQVIYQEQVIDFKAGETVFLPANLGTYYLNGKGAVLLVTDN